MNIATAFYTKLYTKQPQSNTPSEITPKIATSPDKNVLPFPPIMEDEVDSILSKLKTNKTPGPDKIENSTLKQLSGALKTPLTNIYNAIMKTGNTPSEWNASEIRILYKKGSRVDIANYRPLSLSDNLNKVMMKILKNRIYNQLDSHQSPDQAGFRRGHSTIDHIHTINQIIEKAGEYDLELHLLFVDFHKAFDTVDHDSLWEALYEQGCQVEVVEMLENLYRGAEAFLKIEDEGPRFKVGRGVKQGDPLSPNLFTCMLEKIFRELDWGGHGMSINGSRLNNLRFADDIILIGRSRSELEIMGRELFAKCRAKGLEPNITKTKYMSNNPESTLEIEGVEIEKVEEYTYLGRIVSFNNNSEKELRVRKAKAWKSYWALRGVFKGKLSVKSKIKILESCVMPVLTYGAQTWALTKTQVVGLKKTQRAMERSILNIRLRDKIRNTSIREETQVQDVGYTIKKLKFKYAGHIMRASNERWEKLVTEWRPYEGRRKRGRPKTRWRDELENRVGKLWHRETFDRAKWKRIGEAYARLWGSWL